MPSEDFSKPLKQNQVRDPYRVLGLDRHADEAVIKRAYFQLVRQFPPESAPEKFQEIRAAYEQLRTAESRARVDLFLIQAPPDAPKRRRASYDLQVYPEDLLSLAVELAATPMEQDFQS
jgi:curved DNA-binding protein CbpA